MEEDNLIQEKKLNNIQHIIIYFFIYSFLGWAMETAYAFAWHHTFINRGFLYGPLCPLYGWAAVILIVSLSQYRKKPFKLFFISIIVFSIFEYLVGFCLDACFDQKIWWDYTNDFLNLNGRISIMYSLSWGIISIVYINYIHPFIEKTVNWFISKIPYVIMNIGIRVLIVYYILDTAFSFLRY